MLLIFPSDAPTDTATGLRWHWAQSGAGTAQGQWSSGLGAGTALPPDPDAALVVPNTLLSWHRLTLPKVGPNKLRATLEGLLEDRLLDDPAGLHFALSPGAQPARGAQAVWVAVCPRAWLQAQLDALQAAGCSPTRIVPATAPSADGPPRYWAQPSAHGHALTASGTTGVVQLPLERSPGNDAALQLSPAHRALLASTHPDQPTPAAWTDPASAQWAASACPDLDWQPQPAAAWYMALAHSPWDLAQFDLRLAPAHHPGARLRRALQTAWQSPAWRPVRWGLASLAALQLVGLNALAWQERQALAQQQAEMRRLLTQTFPQVTLVLDAPVQMRRELDRLRQARGQASGGDVEVLLQTLANATPPNTPAPQGLAYTPDRATVRGWEPPPDTESAIHNALQTAGWRAQRQGADWQLTRNSTP